MGIPPPMVMVNPTRPIPTTRPPHEIPRDAPTPQRIRPSGVKRSPPRNNHNRCSGSRIPLFRRASLRQMISDNSPAYQLLRQSVQIHERTLRKRHSNHRSNISKTDKCRFEIVRPTAEDQGGRRVQDVEPAQVDTVLKS